MPQHHLVFASLLASALAGGGCAHQEEALETLPSEGTAEAGRFRPPEDPRYAIPPAGKYTNYFDQNTPMPYSLQFHGPYFIHEGWLPGHADSHGCVRLKYEDAKLLFSRVQVGDPVLIKREGRAQSANPFGDAFPFPLF
jgi:hypothetical protein